MTGATFGCPPTVMPAQLLGSHASWKNTEEITIAQSRTPGKRLLLTPPESPPIYSGNTETLSRALGAKLPRTETRCSTKRVTGIAW